MDICKIHSLTERLCTFPIETFSMHLTALYFWINPILLIIGLNGLRKSHWILKLGFILSLPFIFLERNNRLIFYTYIFIMYGASKEFVEMELAMKFFVIFSMVYHVIIIMIVIWSWK